MSERRKSPPVKVAILSVDEYSRLYKSGRVKLPKGRSKRNADWKKDKFDTFEKLLSEAPDVGLRAEYYVFIEYEERRQDKDEFIDIRCVRGEWALNSYAEILLDALKALPDGDELWKVCVQKKIEDKQHFNGLFFQDLLNIKSDIAIEDLKNLSIEKSVIPVINDDASFELCRFDERETKQLNNFQMTYAYGWAAAIIALRRLVKKLRGDKWKEDWENVRPHVKEDLEAIRKYTYTGSILDHDIYAKLKHLDEALWKIEHFPKIPLAYLAVVFHYCNFAVNEKDFLLSDLEDDMQTLEKEHGHEFVSAATYLVGQYIHDEKLMDLYRSRSSSHQHKKKSSPVQQHLLPPGIERKSNKKRQPKGQGPKQKPKTQDNVVSPPKSSSKQKISQCSLL